MNIIDRFSHAAATRPSTGLLHFCSAVLCSLLVACGGGGGGGAPVGVAPTITAQPAATSVLASQPATFAVSATGDAPLTYQWQRNGADVAGANAASYTLAASALADSGAAFRAVVSNVAGSATSNAATLTVTASAPVLGVTAQPAGVTVVAGAAASFTVAATCSSATLAIQWQRGSLAGGVLSWADIAGATAPTYTLSTAAVDSGAQFRAALNCGGMSATTSAAALLTVTSPLTVTMSPLLVTGLREHAEISATAGIVQDAAGSFTFLTSNRIKRLSADLSTITAVAGGGAPAGAVDGTADAARFNAPQGIAQDAAGTLYVADTGNHTIRKITAAGVVSTLAGTAGASGFADGSGAAARFAAPTGIAIGPDGDLYVGDSENHRIRRVTPAGLVSTYAGDVAGYVDGASGSARFRLPRGVAVAANGDLYIADYANLRIRVIARSGSVAGPVSTLAGDGTNTPGFPDGPGNAASIPFPSTLALRGTSLAFTDEVTLLRQVDIATGVVSTIAGTRPVGNTTGYGDGAPGKGRLRIVRGIASVAAGGYLVADTDSLRTVSTAGVIRTVATSAMETNSTATGIGTLPQVPIFLGSLQAIGVDPAGNVVLADFNSRLVRRIAPSGAVSLAAGLPGVSGVAVDGVANEAQFISLGPIASDSAGVLYVTDNYGVRRIAPDGTTSFLAGSPTDANVVDGNATTARFFEMRGIAVGPGGNVFVSDSRAIRRVDPAGNVITYAGAGFLSGDIDGPAATARFLAPRALAAAADGTLYVVDGSTIRRISADGTTVSRLAVADVVDGLAVGVDGTVFYGGVGGLTKIAPGGAVSIVVPKGPATVTGANPTLLAIFGIAVLGPKELVIQANNSLLMKVTLP